MAGILSSVTALSPTPRESCFLATYYRTAGIVDSLLRLDNATHFQAGAMLARSLFELAVDIKLVDKIPKGWMKMVFFVEVEKLRCARQMIAFAKANPDRATDVLSQTEFVAKNEMRIEQNRRTLWPPKSPNSKSLPDLKHWSELTLAKRTELLGEPFDATYKFQYPRVSWYVHSGLTGVVNLPAEFFPTVHGHALAMAFTCYSQILESVIHEMKIDIAHDKIHKALRLATLLPFSKSPEQEAALCRELLG
ncbi:MAG TPA: DUF5677 domain-containing protein [Candidatus Acidoferrales bacterium]